MPVLHRDACRATLSPHACAVQRVNAIEELHENIKQEYSAVLDFDIAFFETVTPASSADRGATGLAGTVKMASGCR